MKRGRPEKLRWRFQREEARRAAVVGPAVREPPEVSVPPLVVRYADRDGVVGLEDLVLAIGEVLRRSAIANEGMTVDEAAVFIGVERKTVYDYANRGKIPHRRLGRRLLFSRSALTRWLAGRD